ncbi:MAG: DUF3256 family protein [Bacteroides sp.]|nr:DUF3256 family protein [Bacteroides sp.]
MNRIMNRLLITLCLLGAALLATAQNARNCFLKMPDSICPLLTEVNRADFIDFLDSKMKAQVTNRLGGQSEMTRLTPRYIHIRMTPQSTWQMRLLPTSERDTTRLVICTVTTVAGPAPDSHVAFYTPDWQPLPLSRHLPAQPELEDFLLPTATAPDASFALREALRQADILLMQADLSPDAPTLTFRLTTPSYMEREAADTLAPHLRPAITYHWKKKRFVQER